MVVDVYCFNSFVFGLLHRLLCLSILGVPHRSAGAQQSGIKVPVLSCFEVGLGVGYTRVVSDWNRRTIGDRRASMFFV